MTDAPDLSNRRPLKSRGAAWARGLAASLAARRISADVISGLGLAFAALGGALLAASGGVEGWPRGLCLILGAVCIQLRLACNLLDGLVAVEHGRASAAGPIWNELPDRFADVLLLAGAGYGAMSAGFSGGAAIGWITAVLAVLTAYVRELGRGLGQPANFSGPMAKPHRMAALTATCAVAVFEPLWRGRGEALALGLAVIALGTLVTVVRRTRRLAIALADRG
ncbi:CDP-alcohol phosphatidyltransferase family protein [Caulobacter hibisci]|uniref:CDP-alcohol phosphatidyltransferase family protein n=1 Tax=Caulobacter hibisci TaxID=2035993 RepID=A0ABS0T3K8_9CAUL|nr:CDP-alcohol phosphatidyltransferase family protein [Caulobacter hibisci]MBI1686346.1 CDP-alcohol phosphatidyltransferase family protein [Caulobacter hibisci]